MDYKKKYENALERANIAHKDEDRHLKATLEKIFPELQESDGERIRQQLLYMVKAEKEEMDNHLGVRGMSYDDMIAWLEKQGQQKSSSPNELKFGVGDIVKSKSQPTLKPMEIKSIGEDCYYCEGGNLIGFAWEDDYEIVEPKELSQSQVTKKSDQDWSEEDEELLRDVIRLIEQGAPVQSIRDHYTNWLKSLKERLNK